jgi:hypothetical protein
MAEKKNKGGRPPTIKTPEEFDRLVDAYVAKCEAEERPLTITGLALALGFYGRQALYEQSDRQGFSDSVKRARSIVEADYERRLGDRSLSAAGTIFALKNFGWTDKLEHELSGPGGSAIATEVKVVHEVIDPKA